MKDPKTRWKLAAVGEKNIPSVYEFFDKPLEAGLWCLFVGKNTYGKNIHKQDFFSCQEIGEILQDYLDLPITANQVKKAFARAGNKIIRRGIDWHKISQPGEEYLKSQKKDEPISVFYLHPSKPIQAKRTLETLVKNIPQGDLKICDPYYGVPTFQVFEMILRYHKNIKFLTSKLGAGESKLSVQQLVKDFKQEYHSRVEIKLVDGNDMHDRYIIARNVFFIVGQGIKDLGNKESLIVAVEDKYGRDIRKTLNNEFDRRWNSAISL